jgi:pimeloyl-ACP methyl ester carboxylesterase
MGLMVILYAMKYPLHVDRIVQIAPMGPYPDKSPVPTNTDPVLREVFAKLGELQKERASHDPEEFCRKFWSILRVIYVTDPKNADKVRWDRCDLPNERNFMPYWTGAILPSIQSLAFAREALAEVTCPVLTIHGTKDRSAPYGGGRDWVSLLPNARLLTVDGAGHGPWIEAPRAVFDAIGPFMS